MKTLVLTLVACLLLAGTAQAQLPTITSVKVDLVNGGTVLGTQTYSWTAVTCNLTPTALPTTLVINPRYIEFDDPATAGRACRIDAGTFLNAQPNGSYFGQVSFVYSDGGVGGPSAQSNPFTRFLYAVATGLKFVR